jgi:uncharacterized protein
VTRPTTELDAPDRHSPARSSVALYTARTTPIDPARKDDLLCQHLSYLDQLHQAGELLLAGPLSESSDSSDRVGGFAVFASPDVAKVEKLVLADPAVGAFLTVTVRRWTPLLGAERLPAPGDTGRVVIEQTIRRLFVEGVSARDARAYFDRTYHPDVVIHEAPSLPYGGDYHGLPGAAEHAVGFTETWDRLQTAQQRELNPRIVATDSEAFVVWKLRGQHPGDLAVSEFPAVSHYRFQAGRVIESRMCLFDTVAVVEFLDARDRADSHDDRSDR